MQKTKTTRMLLFIAIIFYWFSQYVYVPYQTPYLFSLGAASTYIGLIVGAYGISQMLLRIPVGIFADILNKNKSLIIAGAISAAFSSVIRFLIPTPSAFLIANLISGIASSMWISYTVFYSSLYKENELKKAMGYTMAASNGGILLGFITGAFINETFGIGFVFLSGTAAGIISLICVIATKERTQGKNRQNIISLLKTFKNKYLIFYSLIAIVLQAVVLSTALSFTMSYAKQLTSNELELGICSVFFIASSFITSFVISYMKKWKNNIILFILFGCFAVYCALTPLSTAVWQLYLLQILVGMGNGGIMPLLMAAATSDSGDNNKSTAMGFFQSVYSIGMTLGPVLMGFLINGFGYASGFFTMAVLSVICMIVLLIVRLDIAKNKE